MTKGYFPLKFELELLYLLGQRIFQLFLQGIP